MKKRDGHTYGFGLLGVAAVCVASAFVGGSASLQWLQLLVAGGSTIAGAYLLNRLYLDDPEARAQYRQKLRAQPLSEALGSFSSVANIVKLLQPLHPGEEGTADPHGVIADMMRRELGISATAALRTVPLSRAASLYGGHLTDLVGRGIVPVGEVDGMWRLDAAAHRTFTELWAAYGGKLPAVYGGLSGSIRAADLLAMVHAEFPWIRSGTSSGSGSVLLTAADGPTTVQRLLNYHSFLASSLHMTPTDISAIVERSPAFQNASFEDCMRAGLGRLAAAGITTMAWRDALLRREPVTDDLLWRLDRAFGVRTLLGDSEDKKAAEKAQLQDGALALHLLRAKYGGPKPSESAAAPKFSTSTAPNHERGVVSAAALAPIFCAAFPRFLLGTGGETARSSIVPFLLYWEDVFRKHPSVVAPSYAPALREAFAAYEDAAQRCRTDGDGLNAAAFASECAKIQEAFQSRIDALPKGANFSIGGINVNLNMGGTMGGCAQQ